MVTPNPITSKIHDNIFSLISYRVSSEIAQTFGDDLRKPKKIQNQISDMILADNDLRCNEEESGLDCILQGLFARARTSDEKSIEHFAYSDNEIGEKSAVILEELL
jgi:hypothetical protein